MKTLVSGFFKILILILTGFATENGEQKRGLFQEKLYGPPIYFGEGSLRSFFQTDKAGRPGMIGLIFSEAVLNDLPKTRQLIEIPLPQKIAQLPFDHISLIWEPGGQVPEGIFTVPYFEIHFNMFSAVEREQIIKNDPLAERLPEPRYMPVDFIAAEGSTVMAGKVWSNPKALKLQAPALTYTLLMNSYDYNLVSYTPSFTLDHLKSKRSAILEIPLSKAFQQQKTYYPTKYSIAYDSAKKEYSVSLLGFIRS